MKEGSQLPWSPRDWRMEATTQRRRANPFDRLFQFLPAMVDLSTLIFIGYVVFAVLLIYVLLFGESEFHRTGIVGKSQPLRSFFTSFR